MSKIDYQALREAAEKATWGDWDSYKLHRGARGYEVRLSSQAIAQHVLKNNAEFIAAFNPKVALALLDERERNQQYIKSRDQENEDIALTVGRLLIENGQLVADTLRHLADNEIDSDYFAITSTNENGTEIDHEMAITDYALQAAGTVDELVAALESAEKRVAELEAEPVSQTYKLTFEQWLEQQHDKIDVDCGCVSTEMFMHWIRVAYEAGNYPVTPDGWISCSERMPDKLIPVMVMYEDGEMWSAMWNGNRWDDGTEYPDPHSVTHWREMPAAPQKEVK
ncbi:TPA: ead/Ea22-like family protein [Escherichia coli]|nr:ead/Ea22-like family protein [Escherichia coli]